MFLYHARAFEGSAANANTSWRGRLISISLRTSTVIPAACQTSGAYSWRPLPRAETPGGVPVGRYGLRPDWLCYSPVELQSGGSYTRPGPRRCTAPADHPAPTTPPWR